MDHDLREKFFSQLEKEIRELINPYTGLLDLKYARMISCPLCSGAIISQETLFIKNGYTFVRCKDCGMIFSNPQVKEENLNSIYGKSKAEDIWVELQNSAKEKLWKKKYYLECLKLIGRHIDKEDDVNILDVGCSTGYFLELLMEYRKGWKIKGLELSEKAYEIAIKKGLNVEKKLLNQIDKAEKYDIVTLFGVMEHLTDPNGYLQEIGKHVGNNDLYVLAVVPNAYSLYHMFLQDKSLSFDGRDHLLFFSSETVEKLFVINGFDVIHLDTVLTGLDAIMRQIQWYDPNSKHRGDKYLPKKFRHLFEDDRIEEYFVKYDLGLRLRILAKYRK